MLKVFRKRTKGFTLLELMIIVAIVGLLAAIAIPSLVQFKRRSKNSRASADTKEIVAQALIYVNDTNTMPGAANMPQMLWDKSAPGGTLYMAATYDPWGATPTTNYGYHEDASAGVSGEIVSYSVGSAGTGDLPIGGTCTGGGVGYSSYSGLC